MQKQFLRLLHLGQNTFWQLLQATNAAVTAKDSAELDAWQKAAQSIPMHVWCAEPQNEQSKEGCTAFLALLQELGFSYTEHQCTDLDSEALEALSTKTSKDNTLNILCGFNETQMYNISREGAGLWFNGMAACSCPWGALAEAAFNVNLCESLGVDMDTWRICWLGEMTPVNQSLMEAAIYVPYEYFMGIPTWSDPDHSSTDMALKSGAKVFMTREPRLALDDAHIIYMDTALETLSTAKKPQRPIPIFSASDDFVWEKGLSLNDTYLAYALPDARILASKIDAVYPKTDATLQARRKDFQRAALLACLNHMVTSEE